ncbi:MAG: hypothetical protein Q8O30_11370 [Candidatus Omnitrophota bacterium]|nr:hypothetical protein [Candidatus Omnitrophota bacterium]
MKTKISLFVVLLIGFFLCYVVMINNNTYSEEKVFRADESPSPEGISCMKFHGFYNPPKDIAPDTCRPKNVVYVFNPDKTITFKWDCPINRGIPTFSWFCCSCNDNTSRTVPVPYPTMGIHNPANMWPVVCNSKVNPNNGYLSVSCKLTVDPNHEYAYLVGCAVKEKVMGGCSDKLRVINYKK